jgi:ribosomal protein S18 acetylase RimI-like enzyme
VLRATPGLDRGRSNHALTPVRPVAADQIEPALDRAAAFAHAHGIRLGVQVSPEHLHGGLLRTLQARGWEPRWPTLVMTGRPGDGAATELIIDDRASPTWLAAWSACEGRADVEAHARTVFAGLRGRAWFARVGDGAVAIAVPGDDLLGLFCIAVAPERRRTGLGRAIVTALCARAPDALPYLQVEARNASAIALYQQLGFTEVYRYRHLVAPAGARGPSSADQAHDREHPDDDDHRPQHRFGQPAAAPGTQDAADDRADRDQRRDVPGHVRREDEDDPGDQVDQAGEHHLERVDALQVVVE